MTKQRLTLGAWGEDHAAEFLCSKGFRILARNYRCALGEIDIIARERTSLIFVEVKTRRSTTFGLPQEAVGARKQQQLIRAAQYYLKAPGTPRLQPRFDVVAILLRSGQNPEVTHIPNAFSLDG